MAAKVLSAASNRTWEPGVAIDTENRRRDAVHQQYRAWVEKDTLKLLSDSKQTLRDPWGTPYRLEPEDAAETFTVRSAGVDEAFGTADDLTVDAAEIRERTRRDMLVEEGGMPIPAVAFAGGAPRGFKGGPGLAASAPTRVRSYFPETLYVNPLVIADADGKATIDVTMADSITTWRLSAEASDAAGRLGSGTDPVKVFQHFFVDVSLPERLTRNDEIEVPIAIYNYRDVDEAVALRLELGDAFRRLDTNELAVSLLKGEVKGVSVRLQALKAGRHEITVHAQGTDSADAVRRSVRVIPDGRKVVVNATGVLEGTKDVTFDVPKDAIDGGSSVVIRLFPGNFSQVVDGLDRMLRMPSGCFEQTSSSTYPNVLALSYMRAQDQVTPEIEAKALSYISQGWQRLLTFEVEGGGFSWFGDPPANKVLTAFGVQEFADMAKVHEIDATVLDRTRKWLIGQQEEDGSWTPDKAFLHQENWGDLQKGSLLVTAYVARALATSGYRGDALTMALNWLDRRWTDAKDAYSLALIGGAMATAEPDSPTTREVLAALAKLAVRSEDGKAVHFPAGVRTAVYGNGLTANIETTALAAAAFMSGKQQMALINPSLRWLIRQKDDNGTWHATMPTILALTALVQALSDSTEVADAKVKVVFDGTTVAKWALNAETSDVVRQVDMSEKMWPMTHRVTMTLDGKGSPAYQVVATHWVPEATAPPSPDPAFDMAVTYDRTELSENDVVRATASVTSRLDVDSKMLLLDLAVPPGFELVTADLDGEVARERIEKYRVAGRQLIVYLEGLKAKARFELSFRLKATISIKAQSGVSRVYEYYDPAKAGRAPATLMTVDG